MKKAADKRKGIAAKITSVGLAGWMGASSVAAWAQEPDAGAPAVSAPAAAPAPSSPTEAPGPSAPEAAAPAPSDPPVVAPAPEAAPSVPEAAAAEVSVSPPPEGRDEEDHLQTVVVTGVRGGPPRTVAESPAPIDVVSADELKRTGRAELGEALAKVLPSFNFGSSGFQVGRT